MGPGDKVDNEIISHDETLDDLILGEMKLIQGNPGYRFSLDAVLLAHFPEVDSLLRAVDLGTGNGVIPLLLAARAPQAHITGVEIQEVMVGRAKRSVALNGLDDRVDIIQADIREIEKIMPGGSAQLVLSNPPFWKKGEGKISTNLEEAIARHELNLNLEVLIQKGTYLLRQGGKLVIIQRSERLQEAMDLFKLNKLRLKRLRMVHSFVDKEAALVLMEGQKNGQGALTILPPLVIYDRPGEYCRELKRIYMVD